MYLVSDFSSRLYLILAIYMYWPSVETGFQQLQLFWLIDLVSTVWGKSIKYKEICLVVLSWRKGLTQVRTSA